MVNLEETSQWFPNSMKRKRKKSLWVLAAALIPVVWTIMLIDNWKRDFTENYAATSAESTDPALRPVETSLSPAVIAEQLTSWIAGKSRWKLESSETEADGRVKLHLVRSTLVWRFKDDIHVTITPKASAAPNSAAAEPEPSGSVVTAESRSRVGKGDLGQNPRNLRELLGVLRQ